MSDLLPICRVRLVQHCFNSRHLCVHSGFHPTVGEPGWANYPPDAKEDTRQHLIGQSAGGESVGKWLHTALADGTIPSTDGVPILVAAKKDKAFIRATLRQATWDDLNGCALGEQLLQAYLLRLVSSESSLNLPRVLGPFYDRFIPRSRYYHYKVSPPGEVDDMLGDVEELLKPDPNLGPIDRLKRINERLAVSVLIASSLFPHCKQ